MKNFFLKPKDYFIPNQNNGYKPRILRRETATAILAVIVLLELLFLVQEFVVFKKTNFLAAVLPGVLTSLANEERQVNGASPLTENELLNRAAQMKADDMAKRGYFSHMTPDGRTPWYWFDLAGYKYSYAGENLAVNFFDSKDVAEAWMNSPSHRANIVKKDFTETGIGVATGIYKGEDSVFVVELFGTPLAVKSAGGFGIKEAVGTGAAANTSMNTGTNKTATATASVAPVSVSVLGEITSASQPPFMASNTKGESQVVSFLKRVMTSPRQTSSHAYYFLTLLIMTAILIAFFVKIEIQHPALLASGFSLLIILSLFSYVNMKAFRLELKVPPSDITANAIGSLLGY